MFNLKVVVVKPCLGSVASRKNLGTALSAGGLVNFLNASKVLLICIVLHTFNHFFLAVKMFFLIEHKEAHSLLEKFIRQQQFLFSSSFLGTFFGSLLRLNPTIFSLNTTLFECLSSFFTLTDIKSF